MFWHHQIQMLRLNLPLSTQQVSFSINVRSLLSKMEQMMLPKEEYCYIAHNLATHSLNLTKHYITSHQGRNSSLINAANSSFLIKLPYDISRTTVLLRASWILLNLQQWWCLVSRYNNTLRQEIFGPHIIL